MTSLPTVRGTELVCELFVATPDVLTAAFPGWLPPSPRTVSRHLRNPQTRELMHHGNGEPWVVETREPEGPWSGEARCPNLEPFPRISLRPIGYLEMSVLIRVVPLAIAELVNALFAPPGYGWSLNAVSDSATRALADIRSPVAVARDWLERLRFEPHLDCQDLDGVVNWPAVVGKISELARTALASKAGLFLYDGPKAEP